MHEYDHVADTPLDLEPGAIIDIDGEVYIYDPHTGPEGQEFEVIDLLSGVGTYFGWPLYQYDFDIIAN